MPIVLVKMVRKLKCLCATFMEICYFEVGNLRITQYCKISHMAQKWNCIKKNKQDYSTN